MAKWRVVLTDRSFTPKAEIHNFGSFAYNSVLSKLATWGLTVRLDHPQVQRLSDCDGFIKLYRDTFLQGVGPIITAEQAVDRGNQSLAITCADAGWSLGKRLAGKSGTGTIFSTPLDRALIAKDLVDATNTMATTNISTAVETLSAGSASTYVAGPYRSILECLAELGSPLDGFDWQFVPIENWVNGALTGSNVAFLRAKPVIGVNRPNAVFEYGVGTRANILSFTKTRTRDTQATRVFHMGNDPATTVVRPLTASEPTAAQTQWGILEDVVAAGDITDGAIRNSLLDEHLAVRATPRDIVRMTPHIDPQITGRMPQPFVDYFPGDTVTANIVNAGQTRFAGMLRVYGITVTVEQETGFERVELTLEDES